VIVTVTLNPAIDQTLRIPGFAVGRVNRVEKSRSNAGGKGVNVASFLADLGEDVVATGFLGAENSGLFDAIFQRKRIVDRFVRTAGRTRVGIKIVDKVTHQTTDINFPGLPPREEEIEELFLRIAALSTQGRWFVLSGSVPPKLPDSIYAVLTELIHNTGGRVLLDTSGRPLRKALASPPEVMKPNIDELRELTRRNLDSPADVLAAAESLLARGVQRVVVSMGGDGAVFVDRDEALLARPPKVAVRSTVGAGDAMVAGIVHAMIHGLPLADVARTATASGAYAVTRIRSGVGSLEEHRKLMEQVEIETLRH
jgi:1-phosphofructokinase